MTPAQVAVNARAVANLAARLEQLGYAGDAHAEAEAIAMNLLADGYQRIPAPVPTRGRGASRAAIDACKAATAAAVAAAKAKHTPAPEPEETTR